MTSQNLTRNPSRRFFLKTAAKATLATAAVAATGSDALAGALTAPPRVSKSLKMFNTHTLESLDLVFWRDGVYDEVALGELNVLLRDHRENEEMVMDRALFDQMWTLQQRCGGDEVFEIISGYRSTATNNWLRKRSSSSGVAKESYHTKGKAIDIRLRGTRLNKLHSEALAMNAGGVGYYPGLDFIHLDTGQVRNWS